MLNRPDKNDAPQILWPGTGEMCRQQVLFTIGAVVNIRAFPDVNDYHLQTAAWGTTHWYKVYLDFSAEQRSIRYAVSGAES